MSIIKQSMTSLDSFMYAAAPAHQPVQQQASLQSLLSQVHNVAILDSQGLPMTGNLTGSASSRGASTHGEKADGAGGGKKAEGAVRQTIRNWQLDFSYFQH